MSTSTFTTQFPTSVKRWKGDLTAPVIEPFEPSTYNGRLPGAVNIFKKVVDKKIDLEKQFVLCPQYVNTKTGAMADVQFTITGTMTKKEEPLDSVVRELAEEIGLFVSGDQIESSAYRMAGKNASVQNYICQLTQDSKVIPFDKSLMEPTKEKDIRGKKIQILVFGEFDFLASLADKISEPLYSRDTDPDASGKTYLGGFRIVSLVDVMAYYKYEVKSKK